MQRNIEQKSFNLTFSRFLSVVQMLILLNSLAENSSLRRRANERNGRGEERERERKKMIGKRQDGSIAFDRKNKFTEDSHLLDPSKEGLFPVLSISSKYIRVCCSESLECTSLNKWPLLQSGALSGSACGDANGEAQAYVDRRGERAQPCLSSLKFLLQGRRCGRLSSKRARDRRARGSSECEGMKKQERGVALSSYKRKELRLQEEDLQGLDCFPKEWKKILPFYEICSQLFFSSYTCLCIIIYIGERKRKKQGYYKIIQGLT